MAEELLKIGVHSYCKIILEAVNAVVIASEALDAANSESENSLAAYEYGTTSGIYARYAFISACIAVEAGGNSLLRSKPGISATLCEDLEKLQALNKFEVFALVHGKPLDRGSNIYGKMKQIARLRNEYFHPKHGMVEIAATESGVVEPMVAGRLIPRALDFFDVRSGIPLIGDVLRFVSWVVFDSCGLPLDEGTRQINNGTLIDAGVLHKAKDLFGYDLRSFGIAGS